MGREGRERQKNYRHFAVAPVAPVPPVPFKLGVLSSTAWQKNETFLKKNKNDEKSSKKWPILVNRHVNRINNIKERDKMKIRLAQALKEKNRLASEVERLWGLIIRENSKREDLTSVIDVAKTYELVQFYTEKLIELKTKIGLANAGNLQRIYRMDECKSQLSKLDMVNIDDSTDLQRLTDTQYRELKRKVVFSESQILAMREELQQECNRLQDEMDEFNATTTIEFDSPLVKK